MELKLLLLLLIFLVLNRFLFRIYWFYIIPSET